MHLTFSPVAALCCIVALWLGLTAAQECGSLMTYRQFGVHLSQAPECYRNGCGAVPLSSMSSACPQLAPCQVLWRLMKDGQRTDYCAGCGDDIACRIPGWPIMNATNICNTIPPDWIFDTNGECCTANDEAVSITQWVSTLCNGSEWRKPFEFYGGMAQQDWAEWIEPWNWTFVQQGTAKPAACATRGVAMSLLWVDNLFEIGVILVVLIGFIHYVRKGRILLRLNGLNSMNRLEQRLHDPRTQAKVAQFGGGATGAIFWILAGIFGAISQHYSPGYESLPIGYFFILYCTRPSLNGLNFIIFFLVRRLLKYPTPEGLSRSRTRAANLLIGFGYSEWVQQALSLPTFIIVAIAGTRKGFYHPGALLPYWQGSPTLLMYVGALLAIITSFFSLFAVGFFLLEYEGTQRVYRMIQSSEQVRDQFMKELEEREYQLREEHLRFEEELERERRTHELNLKQESLREDSKAEENRSRSDANEAEQRLHDLQTRQVSLDQERRVFELRAQQLAREKQWSDADIRSRQDRLDTELGILDLQSFPETPEAIQRRADLRSAQETLDGERGERHRRFDDESARMKMIEDSIKIRQDELESDREDEKLLSQQEALEKFQRDSELLSRQDEVHLGWGDHHLISTQAKLDREKRATSHLPSHEESLKSRETERIRKNQIALDQQRRHHDLYSKEIALEAARRDSKRLTMHEQLERDRRHRATHIKQYALEKEQEQLRSDAETPGRDQAEEQFRRRQQELDHERQENELQSAKEATAKEQRERAIVSKQEELIEERRLNDLRQQQELQAEQALQDSAAAQGAAGERSGDGQRAIPNTPSNRATGRLSRAFRTRKTATKILEIVQEELDLVQSQLLEDECHEWPHGLSAPRPRRQKWACFKNLPGSARRKYLRQVRTYILHNKTRVAMVLLGREFAVDDVEKAKAEQRLADVLKNLGPLDKRLLRHFEYPTAENYRELLALLPFAFWAFTYAWRWMFWYGFINSMGDRWCPPVDYLNAMPGLFGAFISTAVGIFTNSLISSSSTSPFAGTGPVGT